MNFKADRYSRVAIAVERIVLMKSLPTVVVVRFILYIYIFSQFFLLGEYWTSKLIFRIVSRLKEMWINNDGVIKLLYASWIQISRDFLPLRLWKYPFEFHIAVEL